MSLIGQSKKNTKQSLFAGILAGMTILYFLIPIITVNRIQPSLPANNTTVIIESTRQLDISSFQQQTDGSFCFLISTDNTGKAKILSSVNSFPDQNFIILVNLASDYSFSGCSLNNIPQNNFISEFLLLDMPPPSAIVSL